MKVWKRKENCVDRCSGSRDNYSCCCIVPFPSAHTCSFLESFLQIADIERKKHLRPCSRELCGIRWHQLEMLFCCFTCLLRGDHLVKKKTRIHIIFHFAWKEAWPEDLIHQWQLMAWLLVRDVERLGLNNWWWRQLEKMYVDGHLIMGTEGEGIVPHVISHKHIATAKDTFKHVLN